MGSGDSRQHDVDTPGATRLDLPPIRLSPWQERRAKALICANLNTGLSMARLARECGLSRCHFSRAFHGSTGLSPHQWLTQQRIERARTLLLSACTLTLIAQECGFADQAHFSRVFTRIAGMPPSLWRLERLRDGQQSTMRGQPSASPAARERRATCRSR